MSPQQYGPFRETLEALIDADGRLSLFEFALASAVEAHLDGAFGRPEPSGSAHAGDLEADAASVVATLAHQAGDGEVRPAFEAGRSAYAPEGPGFPAEPGPALDGAALRDALRKFGRDPDGPAGRLMAACRAAVEADRRVTPREAELVRALGHMLGVPTPHADALPKEGA
jgi:hypothetical protein